jgi:hypothetical protein
MMESIKERDFRPCAFLSRCMGPRPEHPQTAVNARLQFFLQERRSFPSPECRTGTAGQCPYFDVQRARSQLQTCKPDYQSISGIRSWLEVNGFSIHEDEGLRTPAAN